MGTSVVLFLAFENVGVIFISQHVVCYFFCVSLFFAACFFCFCSSYTLLCYVSIDIRNNQGTPTDKENKKQTKQNSKETKLSKKIKERNK